MSDEDDVEKAIAMSLVDGSPGSRQRKRNTKDWDVDASEGALSIPEPEPGWAEPGCVLFQLAASHFHLIGV